MVIVEGMDGSGKSRLVQEISLKYDLPIHERASDSKTGPIDNLYEWAALDAASTRRQPLAVYDRHPFISQFVYAPILRKEMDARFLTEESRQLASSLFRQSIVIFCDPGLEAVQANVDNQAVDQYDGVRDHTFALYTAYQILNHYWIYPSRRETYDYNNPDTNLHHFIASHIASRGRNARV